MSVYLATILRVIACKQKEAASTGSASALSRKWKRDRLSRRWTRCRSTASSSSSPPPSVPAPSPAPSLGATSPSVARPVPSSSPSPSVDTGNHVTSGYESETSPTSTTTSPLDQDDRRHPAAGRSPSSPRPSGGRPPSDRRGRGSPPSHRLDHPGGNGSPHPDRLDRSGSRNRHAGGGSAASDRLDHSGSSDSPPTNHLDVPGSSSTPKPDRSNPSNRMDRSGGGSGQSSDGRGSSSTQRQRQTSPDSGHSDELAASSSVGPESPRSVIVGHRVCVTVPCPSVCPSVCSIYRPLQQHAPGLLLWAPRAGAAPFEPRPQQQLITIHLTSTVHPFSALTLLVGWQEGHPACKKLD